MLLYLKYRTPKVTRAILGNMLMLEYLNWKSKHLIPINNIHRRIKLTTTYTHEFTCKFNLRMYPLDKQKCSMEIRLTDSKEDLFDLKLTNLKLYGNDYASQYLIHDPRLDQTQSSSKKLSIELIMDRQRIFHCQR